MAGKLRTARSTANERIKNDSQFKTASRILKREMTFCGHLSVRIGFRKAKARGNMHFRGLFKAVINVD